MYFDQRYKRYWKAPDLREIIHNSQECLKFSLGKRFPTDHVRTYGLGWNWVVMEPCAEEHH